MKRSGFPYFIYLALIVIKKRFREWWPKAWELWVITLVISRKGDLRVGGPGVCSWAPATRYLRIVPVPWARISYRTILRSPDVVSLYVLSTSIHDGLFYRGHRFFLKRLENRSLREHHSERHGNYRNKLQPDSCLRRNRLL